jgi:Zn-dependent protease
MQSLNSIQTLAVLALPVLFAITVHEAAHGWMARRFGDSTAMLLGRVTLNPLKHIDPIGTILVPAVTFLLSSFLFGWAKPVPVNWRNLHHPRRDMVLVALAGPGANLIMAVFWALAVKLGVALFDVFEWLALPLIYMGSAGVLINSILMTLNLLPILPLDGGRVLAGLLPPRMAWRFSRLEPYGLFIVIGLLATGLLGKILWPLVVGVIEILPASEIVKRILESL